MATYEVILPKLGQTVEESRIVEWMVEEGDAVNRGDVLFTIETDKATLDVEAPKKGFVRKILAPAGDVYPVLMVVAYITRNADDPIEMAGGAGPAPAESAPAEVETPVASPSPESQPLPPKSRLFSSPRARKVAQENGVDIASVTGTGPNGRIVEKDVQAYLDAAPKATPVARRLAESLGVDLHTITPASADGKITKADVEAAGESANQRIGESTPLVAPPVSHDPKFTIQNLKSEVPMAGIRAIIADRMHASHAATARVTLTCEVDATEFAALREKLKTKLAKELGFNVSYNDLLIAMAAKALKQFPAVNARLVGDVIYQLAEVHVSLAIDTGRGLVVPVVRDADKKTISDIARATHDLIVRTREGKILPDELSGGTFTLTNLGMFEIDAFTPIINLPEAAILGVGRIKEKPVVVDGEICIRKMMWLSLTFDHRLVDGGPAARFLQMIKQLVEDPYLLLA